MAITTDQKLLSKFYDSIGNKINGHMVKVQEGPLVYNFIIEPEGSISQKVFETIQNTGAMVMLHGQRIVVQIPKAKRSLVWFKKLTQTDEYKRTDAVLPVILGVDTFGRPVIKDLKTMPHLLVCGREGSGKSMFIETLLKSITTKLSPEQCKIIIYDRSSCNFMHWNDSPHLLCPVTTSLTEAVKQFESILQIIDERYYKLLDNNVHNIAEYQRKTCKKNMPFIVIVIEDIVDLMYTEKKFTEKFIETVCSKARAAGIHLIVTTQRATDKKVLTSKLKAFLPTRIAFSARNIADSIQMFGEGGAEQLLPCGDMLYGDAGRDPVRIHTLFIKNNQMTPFKPNTRRPNSRSIKGY